MTERRRWLNKINQRVNSMVKAYGIDRDTIYAQLDDIDGIYVSDDGGKATHDNLNVAPEDFNKELVEAVEKKIFSRIEAEDIAEKNIRKVKKLDPKDVVSKEDIKNEIIGRFSFDEQWQDIKESYYEIEARIGSFDASLADSFFKKIEELGHVWADGATEAQKWDLLQEAKDLYSGLFS